MWEQMKSDYMSSRGLEDGGAPEKKGSGDGDGVPVPVRVRRRAEGRNLPGNPSSSSSGETGSSGGGDMDA